MPSHKGPKNWTVARKRHRLGDSGVIVFYFVGKAAVMINVDSQLGSKRASGVEVLLHKTVRILVYFVLCFILCVFIKNNWKIRFE